MELLKTLYGTTGISMLTLEQFIMIIVSLILLYLAIKKRIRALFIIAYSIWNVVSELTGNS